LPIGQFLNGRPGSKPASPCETKWSRDGTTR